LVKRIKELAELEGTSEEFIWLTHDDAGDADTQKASVEMLVSIIAVEVVEARSQPHTCPYKSMTLYPSIYSKKHPCS